MPSGITCIAVLWIFDDREKSNDPRPHFQYISYIIYIPIIQYIPYIFQYISYIFQYISYIFQIISNIRAVCFREMLAHQHTLLQHDFTQPPSNKKATEQKFTKNYKKIYYLSKWKVGNKKKLFLKIIYLKEGDTSKASSKLEILKNI